MIKLKQKNLIAMLALLLTIFAGCLPEDKIDFSDDGSVGVAKIDEELVLIDGSNNTIIKLIDEGELQIGPSISADGKMIAYAKNEFFKNPDQLAELIPEDQLTVIQQYVRDIHDLIITEGGINKDKIEKGTLFPRMQSKQFASLVYSLIALQAEKPLLDLLKPDELKLAQEVKKQGFKLCHLYVTTLDGLDVQNKQTIHISCFSMISPKISPDQKNIAYLIQNDFLKDNDTYNLHVATLDSKIKAAQVAANVAFGAYDWSPNGRSLAFIENESPGKNDDFMLGTLTEREIIDENGQLDVKPDQDRQKYNSIATHYCQGEDTELAGMIFYPWLSASYHPSGRIFFSSAPIKLPATELQLAEEMSIFCYDPLLKTVTDVLPKDISAQLSTSVVGFEISPDGKKLLLPLQKQRFLIYTLGKTDSIDPLTEADAFGEKDVFKMAPAFKGNNQIACLVEKDCHLLKDLPPDSLKDKEIAIIDHQGKFVDLLKLQP